MKLSVYYDREHKEQSVELEESAAVKDLLNKMRINPETVIVSKNNDVITGEENLRDGDRIKIISVISGG